MYLKEETQKWLKNSSENGTLDILMGESGARQYRIDNIPQAVYNDIAQYNWNLQQEESRRYREAEEQRKRNANRSQSASFGSR